jgi:hypothetical protein
MTGAVLRPQPSRAIRTNEMERGVRYYGFLAPAAKKPWEQFVRLLDYTPVPAPPPCLPAHLLSFLPGPQPHPAGATSKATLKTA